MNFEKQTKDKTRQTISETGNILPKHNVRMYHPRLPNLWHASKAETVQDREPGRSRLKIENEFSSLACCFILPDYSVYVEPRRTEATFSWRQLNTLNIQNA